MIFERKDTPTIQDGIVVRYTCGPLEISASRNGVCISTDYGMMFTDRDCPEEIFECLRRAHAQYVQLRRGGTPWTQADLDDLFLEPK